MLNVRDVKQALLLYLTLLAQGTRQERVDPPGSGKALDEVRGVKSADKSRMGGVCFQVVDDDALCVVGCPEFVVVCDKHVVGGDPFVPRREKEVVYLGNGAKVADVPD